MRIVRAVFAVVLFCALLSYHHDDPSWLHLTTFTDSYHNILGYGGAQIAALLVYLWGGAAWLALLWPSVSNLRVVGALMLLQNSCAALLFYYELGTGGVMGSACVHVLYAMIDRALIPFLLYMMLVMALILLGGFAWVKMIMRHLPSAQVLIDSGRRLYATLRSLYTPVMIEDTLPVVHELEEAVRATYQEPEVDVQEAELTYQKPDLALFAHKRIDNLDHREQKAHELQAQLLVQKLTHFGIRGCVTGIMAGPVVTLFEYAPDIDIPISKIVAREDDLALALGAVSLRIIAPIPGKSVVGFEVAHGKTKVVSFGECMRSQGSIEHAAALPFVVGVDTCGSAVVLDLATMPHLLLAGSTGSGKSVALNTLLISLLCHTTPDELRLILIDPKRLEFAQYADTAHLLFPVVSDAASAIKIMHDLVRRMMERYDTMAAVGARTIEEYRQKTGNLLPYIVMVIDELADLMMVAGKDIEGLIARLAAMARASGIHVVVATQRPSVDVITGLIKANFPVRIACKVASKIDSRTILDMAGAEKLLGKGDMLMLDGQGKVRRLHGAYLTQQEMQNVVNHIKSQATVSYEQLPQDTCDETLPGEDAALYEELLAFVKTVDEISISLLQRKFRIGYNRSARMIDLLESKGVISPAGGSKHRKVLH